MTRKYSECEEQIAAMDWLRLQHPQIALHTLHIGNERKSSYYMGFLMKRMGVLAGASDLLLAWPSGQYHGMFLEVKSKTGKPTELQMQFIERMNKAGYYACVCYGAEEIINTIKWYLNQNGTSSSGASKESDL